MRSPRLSGGATFKTQRQLVAESLVFDRCGNERGSSTALTSAAIYRRISIPHLGFRYGYWSARDSLNAGVRVCAGVGSKLVAPKGAAIRRSPNGCDRARFRILDRLVCYTGRCRFIRQMEGESCLS